MDEEQFKAVFVACFMSRYWDMSDAVSRANEAWKLYAESRPVPEVSPEYARHWFDLNWPGLDDAIHDADHATLLKVAELVGYEPMEPRP